MPTISLTKDFDWSGHIKNMPTISPSDTDYFDRWDANLHHKEYDMVRTERRIRLSEAFNKWYDSGSPFATVRDNKDGQFKKTKATVKSNVDGMIEDKVITTSYPLFQALRNVVLRDNKLCKCSGEDKPCNQVCIWWNIAIPHMIVIYRHGATSPYTIYPEREIVWKEISKDELFS